MKNTLKDLNVYLSKKQSGVINTLVEQNPILGSIPVKPASHGFYNVYPVVNGITPMQEVDYDTELPTVGISFELGRERLGKIGGTLPIPQDAAKEMGGYDVYANSRLPTIIAEAGNTQEKRIFYKGFLKRALANGKAVSCGGTTPNKQWNICAVHWDNDSTVGLYNGNSLSNGKIFVQLALNGGKVYKVQALGNALGAEVAAWLEFGLQLADDRYVAALVNIEPKQNADNPDKIDGLPTAMQLEDMIAQVRGDAATTVIYCHQALIGKLAAKFQFTQRTVTNADTGVSYQIDEWQRIPFIGSYNVGWGEDAVINL